MGFPGLQQQAFDLYCRSYKQDHFYGGDFYIDGINFAQRVRPRGLETRIENAEQYDYYEQASLIADAELRKLKRLRPRKIVAVFDAMISADKFAVRMSRSEKRLRKGIVPMGLTEVLAERMFSSHKEIKIIYSGAEAEDEIMKLIDEDRSRGQRMQFVFSGDSDFYRFNIRNAARVQIVPHMRQSLNPGTRIRVVPLKLAVSLVPKNDRVYSPILRPGQSVENPKVSSRKFQEFLNCGYVHKCFFISHGPLLIKNTACAPLGLCPFDTGIRIRRVTYGLIMDKFFQDRPDVNISTVEEWVQEDFRMVSRSVQPLHGELQQAIVNQISSTPMEKLVRIELESVAEKYQITANELSAVTQAVAELYSGQIREDADAVSDRANNLYLLIKGVSKSIRFLNDICDVRADAEKLDRELWPAQLEAYLEH